MMEQEIVDYILQAQKHGLPDFEIKQNLLNVGWEASSVEDSLVFAIATENKAMSSMQDMHKGPSLSPITSGLSAQPQDLSTQMPPPGPVLSDANFEKSFSTTKPLYKKPLLWVIILILLFSAGGVYAYFGYFAATPAKILSNFLTKPKAKTFNTDYTFSYNDSTAASSTGNFGFSINGTSNSDFTDSKLLKQSNNINASLASGATSFGVNLKYLLLGQVIYFDIGQIPQLKNYLPDPSIEWVKLDFDELKKQQNQSFGQSISKLSLSPEDLTQLKNIWSKNSILTLGNSSVKENLNGAAVYHLKEQFNNQAFSSALLSSLQIIAKQSTSTDAQLTDSDKQIATALINKFQVKEFDIWIGQKDSELHKFHLLISAPTVKDLSDPNLAGNTPGLGGAMAKSADAKRIADMRQAASVLELYYSDYGGYPDAANGVATNISPTYISAWPIAPEPANGTCTDYYNSYWYSPQGKPHTVKGQTVYPSYKLTFCLGADTGGYKAGIASLTPNGISANIACPTTPEQCVNSKLGDDNSQILSSVNKMTFGAQIKIDATYSGFGTKQNITAPVGSTDILDLIKSFGAQVKSAAETSK